jgi:hypothetical protein
MIFPHEEIAVAAYYIWETTGREDSVANWYEAERELEFVESLPEGPGNI